MCVPQSTVSVGPEQDDNCGKPDKIENQGNFGNVCLHDLDGLDGRKCPNKTSSVRAAGMEVAFSRGLDCVRR